MFKYLMKRAFTYLVMTFIATSIAFWLSTSMFRPGLELESRTPRPSPDQVKAMLAGWGLDPDRPTILKYFDWVQNLFLRFDWGFSPDGASVNSEFFTRASVSFRLMIIAAILQIVIGVALGVYAASRQYKFSDRALTQICYILMVIPSPVTYMVIRELLIPFLNDNIFGDNIIPTSGMYDVTIDEFWPSIADQALHMVMPTFALTLIGVGGYLIAQRQYLLDNVGADFVRTARATGLTREKAISKHALRVSFIPVAQMIAFTIPAVFLGAFIAESTFAWHGVANWSLQSIAKQDVSVATAMTAFGCVLFAVGAILADFAVTVVDPRVRL